MRYKITVLRFSMIVFYYNQFDKRRISTFWIIMGLIETLQCTGEHIEEMTDNRPRDNSNNKLPRFYLFLLMAVSNRRMSF